MGCHQSWSAQIQSKMLFRKALILLSLLVLLAALIYDHYWRVSHRDGAVLDDLE